jgi:rhamnose utilization protein RhaD (predicted bifunctional aldolase and dehydrogenase)
MKDTLHHTKESIACYCEEIGLDSKLVQGAGGNVSWKDQDTLWIKASGEWLADARKKDIFLPIDLKHLKDSIKKSDFDVIPKLLSKTKLRPSIETLFHAVMPHRVILHLHPIVPLSYLVRKDCFQMIEKKINPSLHWDLIKYEKPGNLLAKEISKAMIANPKTDILFLQNHGIIIGGDDIYEIDIVLKKIIRDLNEDNHPDYSFNNIVKNLSLDNIDLISVDIPKIHNLVFDKFLYENLKKNWALYPDHVVFLGHKAHCYDSLDILINENGSLPELIFIKNRGVFTKSKMSLAKLVQLKCYYDVLTRQKNETELNLLSDNNIMELLNWDAEHYRQKIAKN